MNWQRTLTVGIIAVLAFSSLISVYAIPSGGVFPARFTFRNEGWYDTWGYRRDYYLASDNGFLPNVAYESLGPDREKAYGIGAWFKANYPQKTQRAEAILAYVQRWTDYGYDSDNVFMNGESQPEWAWNADESAHMFNENTGEVAIGDCEDMAFLCSTIYLAAGFDVTLVSPESHVALMIWLPEYDDANQYWDLEDGRGKGWIWVEATGEDNPLGWTPPDFTDGNFEVYPLGFSKFNVELSPQYPQAEDDVEVVASVVSARGTVSKAYLSYSIGSTNKAVQMTPSGSNFEAVIPAQSDGTTITGTVNATDTYGFTSEYSFEYVVGQEGGFDLSSPLIETVLGFLVILVVVFLLRGKKAR